MVKMKIIPYYLLLALLLLIVVLSVLSLTVGQIKISLPAIFQILLGHTVENPSWSYIIENRLNRTLVAVFSGAALSVSGLILQVFFRNPLAGPGVLGVSSGVNLGVALVILGGVSVSAFSLSTLTFISGLSGAILVLIILMLISKFIANSITLLIVGLMLSYFTSAFVSLLYHWADVNQTRVFVLWGLGSFDGISSNETFFFVFLSSIFILISFFMVKPLNALVLGEKQAASLGINLKSVKFLIILLTAVLTSLVTVYSGPVGFIGVAVPQLVRLGLKQTSHFWIILYSILIGAMFALLADLLVRFSGGQLPLNTVTSLFGAPIVLYTILKMNKTRFN